MGAVAAIAATLLLAPVVTAGSCADAVAPEASVCGSVQRSILGVDTDVWIWLGALGVIVGATIAAVRSMRDAG